MHNDNGNSSQDLINLLKNKLQQDSGFAADGTPVIVDANISPQVAADLRAMGFNAQHVDELGIPPATPDSQINNLADQLNASVLTKDRGSDLGGGFGNNAVPVPGQVNNASTMARILQNAGIQPSL